MYNSSIIMTDKSEIIIPGAHLDISKWQNVRNTTEGNEGAAEIILGAGYIPRA